MAICSAIASAQPFIPGSNCGISKPLKLIEKVPLDGAIDTSDLECSIVKDKVWGVQKKNFITQLNLYITQGFPCGVFTAPAWYG